MNRREVITLVGGAAAVWPLAARAQQGERVRRIGAFISLAAGDAEGRARLTAFVQGLQDLGWNDGRNVRVDMGARTRAGQARTQAPRLSRRTHRVKSGEGSRTPVVEPTRSGQGARLRRRRFRAGAHRTE